MNYLTKLFKMAIVSTIVASFFSPLLAKPTIHWAKYAFPPYFITEGPFANQGISDQLYDLLQAHLPQYEHSNYTEIVPRILRDFKKEQITCSNLTFKEERKKLMLYSEKAMLIPNLTLHFLAQESSEIEHSLGHKMSEATSLKAVLDSNSDLKLGVIEKRSYGDEINAILKESASKLIHFQAGDGLLHQVKMTEKQRVDFFIEYPVVSYFLKKSGKISSALTSVNIKENNNTHTYVYIVCSKNQVGAEAIEAINQVINKTRHTQEYRSILESWLPDHLKANYARQYQKHMLN